MLNSLLPMLSQFLYSRKPWASVLLLILCNGCLPQQSPAAEVDLKISAVQSAGRPGVYYLTGSTNLPEHSQITVAALRYLRFAGQRSLSPEENSTYSILARQIIDVEQGKWQTTLNLWQAALDGRFQESWQLNESQIGLAINPANEVTFLATFEPTGQIAAQKQQKQQIQDLQGSLVRFSTEGQQYVQASQTLQVALPIEKTTPPSLKVEDINDGWGKRYEIQSEPSSSNIRSQPVAKTSQTNAPLSHSEFLR